VDQGPVPEDPRHGARDTLGLTERELEVLSLVALGYTNRRIAEALFITEKTAGHHVSNVLGKLGAATRMEAAAIAHRLDLFADVAPG
jgi:DNA-binding NarL/FixJ family response regulator